MAVEVSVIMGSKSDAPIMGAAREFLESQGVEVEMTVVSAHRTPERMFEFAKTAHERGIKVIIAGAGGAAHLPGMVASLTTLPVIGVPIHSSNSVEGIDSLLSIMQMPNGIPVATVAVNAAQNAGILALRMLAIGNTDYQPKLVALEAELKAKVTKQMTDEVFSTDFVESDQI